MLRIANLIILSFILFIANAYSATFTVTSNADSGNGTLRKALQDAASNGSAEIDYIHFNLSGGTDNDRTIRLRSQLPVVTSKVIIDGTTQPSARLGISDAKVIIEPEFKNGNYSCLVITNTLYNDLNVSDVEIYGLYIRDFATITSLSNVNTNQGSGIVVGYKARNIKIGKPGHGNVICGNINGIQISGQSNYYDATPGNISIQSNFIGVMDNGTTPNTNLTGISADLYESSLTIGGDDPGEGNVIAANGTDISISRLYYSSSFRSKINIISNKIGTDHSGTKDYKALPIFSTTSAVEMYGIKVNAQLSDLSIFKNVVSGHQTCGISINSSDFVIGGNYIGTGINGTEQLGNTVGIRIGGDAQGKIGGTAATDPNYIGYNNFGIDILSNKSVTITRNSIFCNERFGIGQAPNAPQAFIQVLKQRPNYIAGKSTPNAEIELFYTDDCVGSCQGKTYFATQRADNSGKWEYTGTLTGHVVATASFQSYVTSMFSDAALRDGDAIVEPLTCNKPGSITIPEQREGMTFKWFRLQTDGASVSIPGDHSITNLAVGTYELQISDGCKTSIKTFSITDQILTQPVIVAPVPQCGQTGFTFNVSTLRGKGNLVFTWLDGADKVVGSGQQVFLPQGTYKVKVTDDAGCVQFSNPVTIVRKPAPVINTSQIRTTAAACGQKNGAIKGLQFTDVTGTATYTWYTYNISKDELGDVAGSSADLENVEGGYYMLKVTDQGGCSPVFSSLFYISIYNSVIISNANITNATCNKESGSISGITITEADTYEWFSPAGLSLEKDSYSAGMQLQLKDRPAGTYRLDALNSVTGCSSSRLFTIYVTQPQEFTASAQLFDATCGLDNGSLRLTYSTITPTDFQWKDASGNDIAGTATDLKDLPKGDYTLFVYDYNKCETILGPYHIDRVALLTITPRSAVAALDQCGLQRGSVKGIVVTGGIPGANGYTYKWEDKEGNPLPQGRDLLNAGEGEYRVTVTDNTTCGIAVSEYYTVGDQTIDLEDPTMADVRVCYTTEIMIPITNKDEGTYQLFADLSSTNPIMETENGIFIFTVSKSTDYYIRRKLGHCLSGFTKMHVEVTNDNLEIANTMTPNGDGMNDIWSVKGLPDYSDIRIQVYSRDGQLVYDNTGQYIRPFDGYFRGALLPAGVYYYKIDLRGDCKPMSGSITLLR